MVTSAESWLEEVQAIQNMKTGWPFIQKIIELVNTGQNLGIQFPELEVLTAQIEAGKAWISQLQHVFLRKMAHVTLLEVSYDLFFLKILVIGLI